MIDCDERGNGFGKVLYVVGCGRSGSTILGFCLGNAENVLDLGEVLDFGFMLGEPNGFEPGTPNYAFWHRVVRRVAVCPDWPGFDEFAHLQRRFDRHRSLVVLLAARWLVSASDLDRYHAALRALYDAIQVEAQGALCVDSSKYPSRLLHLAALYGPERLSVIHLVRDPAGLVEAFAGTEQGPPRRELPTLLYYLAINGAATVVLAQNRAMRSVRLSYEDLCADPAASLTRVGRALGVNLSRAVEKIVDGRPLQRGFIFNGNRMRMQAEVVFRMPTAKQGAASGGGLMVRLCRSFFFRWLRVLLICAVGVDAAGGAASLSWCL